MFQLTFLGTSSGVPTKERNVSAMALECIEQKDAKHHPWILVDCGEGTQHQLIKSPLASKNLVAILITHVHGDHCYGLPGLLASLGMQGRKERLVVIAPQDVLLLLQVMEQKTHWHINYPIEFIAIETLLQSSNHCHHQLVIHDGHTINIDVVQLSHRCPSYGFVVTQMICKQKLDTQKLRQYGIDNHHWRYIFKSQNQTCIHIDGQTISPQMFVIKQHQQLKVVIAGDNDMPALLSDAVKDAKVLVHEATYTEDVRQKILAKPAEEGGFDPKHSSSKMVAQFAQKAAIPALILTHFSARYASFCDSSNPKPNMGHIDAEARHYYDGKLILAKDFMQVVIADDEVDIVT